MNIPQQHIVFLYYQSVPTKFHQPFSFLFVHSKQNRISKTIIDLSRKKKEKKKKGKRSKRTTLTKLDNNSNKNQSSCLHSKNTRYPTLLPVSASEPETTYKITSVYEQYSEVPLSQKTQQQKTTPIPLPHNTVTSNALMINTPDRMADTCNYHRSALL